MLIWEWPSTQAMQRIKHVRTRDDPFFGTMVSLTAPFRLGFPTVEFLAPFMDLYQPDIRSGYISIVLTIIFNCLPVPHFNHELQSGLLSHLPDL